MPRRYRAESFGRARFPLKVTLNPLGRRYAMPAEKRNWVVLTREGISRIPRAFVRAYLEHGLHAIQLPKHPIKPGTNVFRLTGELDGLVAKVRKTPAMLRTQVETLKLVNQEHAERIQSGALTPLLYMLRPLKVIALSPHFYLMEWRNVPDAFELLNAKDVLNHGPPERAQILRIFLEKNQKFETRELVASIGELDYNLMEIARTRVGGNVDFDFRDENYLVERAIPFRDAKGRVFHKFEITLIDQPKDN